MAELAAAAVGQAAPIASRVDQGLGLDEPGYQQVLEAAGHAAALQQLNAGAGAAAPRVVVLAGGAAATAPSLIEQHLIAAGRQGVIVVLPEAHQVCRCCWLAATGSRARCREGASPPYSPAMPPPNALRTSHPVCLPPVSPAGAEEAAHLQPA